MKPDDLSVVMFGPFRLETRDLRLERDGQPVRLPLKAVEMLVLLIRAHPGTVSREDLRAALWPDSIVEDANLHQNVYLLRKALGALPDGRSYIETLAKRGYRFLGDPAVETAPPVAEPRARWQVSRAVLVGLVAVGIALTLVTAGRPVLSAHPPNPEAARLYAKARAIWKQRRGGNGQVESYLREAIAIDPSFLPAQTGLADALAMHAYPAREAQEMIERLLATHDRSAEAHATAGFIAMFHRWDWEDARVHLERAIELDPKYSWARQWYGLWNSMRGQHAAAEEQLKIALQNEPSSANLLAAMCWTKYLAGDASQGVRYCKEALEIDPRFKQAHEWLVRLYSQLGDADSLVEQFTVFADEGDFRHEAVRVKIYQSAYRQGGLAGLWQERLRQIESTNPYWRAEALARLGRNEEALAELERAVESHEFYTVFVAVEPAFQPLHDNPAFRRLCGRVGL